MGGKNSVLSEEKLEEYVQLTYLTKAEVLYILNKLSKLQLDKNAEYDLNYRHTKDDIMEEFQQLKFNPFRERIFKVFSSQQDDRISFEDFLDLSSAMSLNCPLSVKAMWAFKIFDFDEDNQITKSDLCDIIDRLTLAELTVDETFYIGDILLKEMDLQHTGGMSQLEFLHSITKIPEFATAFSFRL